jgi:hypothetical protein
MILNRLNKDKYDVHENQDEDDTVKQHEHWKMMNDVNEYHIDLCPDQRYILIDDKYDMVKDLHHLWRQINANDVQVYELRMVLCRGILIRFVMKMMDDDENYHHHRNANFLFKRNSLLISKIKIRPT